MGLNRGSTIGTGASSPIIPFKFAVQVDSNAPAYLSISGVTQNASSAALVGCTVKLYRTSDDVEIATTVSDGSGNYVFPIQALATGGPYYIVAYKAGSPDVAGTTVNTIIAS